MDMFTVFKEIDDQVLMFKREADKIYNDAGGIAGKSDRFYDWLKCEGAIKALTALKETLLLREALYVEAMATEYERFQADHT